MTDHQCLIHWLINDKLGICCCGSCDGVADYAIIRDLLARSRDFLTDKASSFYSPMGDAPGVWVEFERGDPDYPIWSGVFWGIAAERPVMSNLVPPGVSGITLQTQAGNCIVISDVPGPTGGILLQTVSGATILPGTTPGAAVAPAASSFLPKPRMPPLAATSWQR
jgi:hypothetical protein